MSSPLTLPGLIDCHVHFREPGYEHKSTMRSESAAARAGGVTTVCEMPNTNPPTVTVAALADKVRRAHEIDDVDLRFFFGVTAAAHLATLRELWTGQSEELRRLKARCSGVKVYIDHSTGDQKVDAELIPDIFRTCAELSIPLVAHCEDPALNAAANAAVTDPSVASHSRRRPPESEAVAIERTIALARATGAALHIAHLSTKEGLALVRAAKADGLPVTCEVAPHHLFLTVDDFGPLGPLAKMNPPLRTADHRDALWEGLLDGAVDCVATDHAPHTLAEKQAADPLKAPSGVPGVELMVPLLLTVCAGDWPHPSSSRPPAAALTTDDIVRLCFTNPNRIFSLGKRTPAEGGDVVTVDLDDRWTVHATHLHSPCGWTPYEGWNLTGRILSVSRS